MKKLIGMFLIAVMVIGVGLVSQASAYTVMSLIDPGPNQASDEDREYLIDRTLDGIGVLSVGDSLRGSININTMNSAGANLGGATPGNELSGVFQVMVTSVTQVDVPLVGTEFIYTFGVDPAFATAVGQPGAVVALYEDTTHNYTGDFAAPVAGQDDGTTLVSPSPEDVSVGPYLSEEGMIATAIDGQLFAILGFTGAGGTAAGGEGMNATTIFGTPALASVLSSFGFTSGTTYANANLGLDLLQLGPAAAGLVINRVTPSIFGSGLVDFALSQQLRGVSDLTTPFEISSNTNISFNAAVPEPSTLLLFGSGLLGVGILSRRKMKK